MKYCSTRNKNNIKKSAYAILNGIAEDGGLFVPDDLSSIHFEFEDYIGQPYNYIAKKIISSFFTDIDRNLISRAVDKAYCESNFSDCDIFPVECFNNLAVLNLTTGKTLAFKDAALSILPHLMNIAIDDEKYKKILILTATSGDTGKAAMEGFKNIDNIDLIVFYPYKGVSEFQLKQMLTTDAINEYAFAINGNFDDAQSAVKEIFTDENFKNKIAQMGIHFSSANSINIGRLVPQIVYYYHAYSQLVKKKIIKMGDKINISVPTGNFGNILAGYYAFKTGLPVNQLICASNENNVLTDFFNAHEYDANRPFVKTISPSMDILISSNLERLIFELNERNDIETAEYMSQLKAIGRYKIKKCTQDIEMFKAYFATEKEILDTIKEFYNKYGYLIDTHTATAVSAINKYHTEYFEDSCFDLILSTASPYKFSKDVLLSLSGKKSATTSDAVHELNELTGAPIPPQVIETLNEGSVLENIININEIETNVLKFLER